MGHVFRDRLFVTFVVYLDNLLFSKSVRAYGKIVAYVWTFDKARFKDEAMQVSFPASRSEVLMVCSV